MGEGLAEWPGEDWADALNALSAAWRDGHVPGFLFNGTRARRLDAIRTEGFRASDAMARLPGGASLSSAVHVGTPEVAAWYMRDTATGILADSARPA